MDEIGIYLGDIENAKDFCNAIQKFDIDMDLDSGHRVVDAKSLLGVISICVSKKCVLKVVTPITENDKTNLLAAIDKWRVK